jgi:heavy metal translocating P-type ATPase
MELVVETLQSLINRKFALDYIAITAILASLLAGEYLVAAIIVLMLAGGSTLEKYGMAQAKNALTALTNRIPHSALKWTDGVIGAEVPIESVQLGDQIAIRKGEVIPLDGEIISDSAQIDESSLTGEALPVYKQAQENAYSGTVNLGELLIIKVTKPDSESTYRKIINMVKQAQADKSPLIRLADKYSVVFTLIVFSIAITTYLFTQDFDRVLAVLVIATPCPLILATPIALMGGMNSAAGNRIIIRRLASIEVMSRVKAIVLDKTGTITIGRPVVSKVDIVDTNYDHNSVVAIAAGIERGSLHPLAKAIVQYAHTQDINRAEVTNIHEQIGHGISGEVAGKVYSLSRDQQGAGMEIIVKCEATVIARFQFEDQLKPDAKSVLQKLIAQGLQLHMFTGDQQPRAQQALDKIGIKINLQSQMSPAGKQQGIKDLQAAGLITAMVGDGINDAPALAIADVGMVFSNDEQTASSEAADIIFLGGDMAQVATVLTISQRTITIAMQSILFGIGFSIVGMILAAVGLLPAIIGAFIQEFIDVAVIINALRASKAD